MRFETIIINWRQLPLTTTPQGSALADNLSNFIMLILGHYTELLAKKKHFKIPLTLTLSLRRSLSQRNHSIDFQNNSTGQFLYDRDLRYEKVQLLKVNQVSYSLKYIIVKVNIQRQMYQVSELPLNSLNITLKNCPKNIFETI